MQHLLLKEFPKYENLVECSKEATYVDPSKLYSCLHVLKAGDEVFRAIATTFQNYDISHGRSMVLFALMAHKGEQVEKTPAVIADALGVTRATITGLLDGLEKEGLVQRRQDPNDRRMILVKLTEKGEELMSEITPAHHLLVNQIMDGLSEEERNQLTGILSKLTNHIELTCPIVSSSDKC